MNIPNTYSNSKASYTLVHKINEKIKYKQVKQTNGQTNKRTNKKEAVQSYLNTLIKQMKASKVIAGISYP